jgi:hypothetical protein
MGLSSVAQNRMRVKRRQDRKAAQQNFTNTYSIPEAVYQDAEKAGVDPRTIEAYKKQAAVTLAEARAVQGKASKPGAVGSLYKKRLEDLASTVGAQAAELSKKVKTDTEQQPVLQEVKQKRKSLVQAEAKALTRKTGRRALLTSPGGGSGFYGGYFNGK